MNPLLKLLDEIDSETRAAVPLIFLRAFQIMEERQAALIAEIREGHLSKAALLRTYKAVLHQYATFKILWHRWCKRNDYCFPCCGIQHQDGNIQMSIRRYKAELMGALELVKAKIPGITYRELNKLSFEELAKKWLGLHA